MSTPESVTARQLLRDRGFHVFPADHPDHPECIGRHGPTTPCDGCRGKHPAVKWGVWAVTVTLQMIDLEWGKHGGLANAAVACGPSSLVILDEDEQGELERWCAAYGFILPETYTVITARGRHLYFHWDHTKQRIGNSPKAMDGFKIDVRGDGGYAIAEGSQHASGAVYVGNGLPVADLPQDVAQLLLTGAAHNTDQSGPEPVWENATQDFNTTRIAFHDRHKALIAYAGRLRKSGLDEHEAEAAFRARWLCCEQPEGQIPEAHFHRTACPYPVTWEEAQAKLRDVFTRYPAGGNLNDAEADQSSGGRSEEDTADDAIRAFKFPDGHRPTDIGNAARLLRHAGHKLRYVHAWGKWLVYQRGRWIIDEKDALVTEIAKQVAKGLFELAAKTAHNDPDEAKPIWDWALKSCASGAITAMIRLARGHPGILVEHEQLDADPWLLNVTNGSIDLRTGKLRPHDPADLCTMQAPVTYDPNATTPLWKKCLRRWQPDATVLNYLQVRAGASAAGIPTETVDIDYGHGSNGKSKFHGAIQHVLGPYATVPHKSLLVAGRFEQHPTVIADLFGRRLAVASETQADEALNDEAVKNLTGGDRLKGRRMREDPWEFWPTHTLIMFSNHKPAVHGRDEGIWRRLRLVPWQVTIPDNERDEALARKLRAEASGILGWIVDGAIQFNAGGLHPPPAVRNATKQYRADEDAIGRFIAEVLDIDTTETGLRNTWCYSCDIKAELDDWCAEQGIEEPPRMNEIATTLREKGCEDGGRKKVHGKRSTIWHGVSVTQKGSETP
jgi:P4 family phage/plasmid primase-like protien